MEIWYRGIAYINANPADGYKRLVEKVNEVHGTEFLTEEDMTGIWNNVEYFPESPCDAQAFFYDPDSPRYWQQSFDAINDVYLANGSIKERVSPDEVLALDTFQKLLLEKFPC